MAALLRKKPGKPGPAVWVSVTLLWGTVFFFTSAFTLSAATSLLGKGFFAVSSQDLWRVYGFHLPVLVVFALAAMTVKNLFDPKGSAQIERQQAVVDGKREKMFVSFAGSIATGFFFTWLTASTFLWSARFTGLGLELPVTVILTAAVFNILAGLLASLLVGVIFLAAGVGR